MSGVLAFPDVGHRIQLLTTEQMARVDRVAMSCGIGGLDLMERAGRAVAREATRMVAWGASIVVLCGPGNNGGDGYVAARVLKNRGYDVRVFALKPPEALRGDAAAMAQRWLAIGEISQDDSADAAARSADLIIDAVFGAGLDRPFSDATHRFFEPFLQSRPQACQVLAVDVPSGLDGTRGAVIANPCVQADRTVTFHRFKTGHVLFPGRALCGALVLADIGIPDEIVSDAEDGDTGHTTDAAETVRVETGLLDASSADCVFRPLSDAGRRSQAHKYDHGHTLVFSGPAHQTGAARLSARAALRVGSGLVTIAARDGALLEHAAHATAIMLRACNGLADVAGLLADTRKNAAVIGPGYGVGDATCDAVLRVLSAQHVAVVLDADALTSFAKTGRSDALFAAIHDHGARVPDRAADSTERKGVVLTPHEGEFARLFPDLDGGKLERAREAARRSGAIVVLKGPDTVVADPSGRARISVNGPLWLATAGTGDVLAGLIAGLAAQGLDLFQAACAAVWLHGACAQRFGPGLIAEDLPETLPRVLAEGVARQPKAPR